MQQPRKQGSAKAGEGVHAVEDHKEEDHKEHVLDTNQAGAASGRKAVDTCYTRFGVQPGIGMEVCVCSLGV